MSGNVLEGVSFLTAVGCGAVLMPNDTAQIVTPGHDFSELPDIGVVLTKCDRAVPEGSSDGVPVCQIRNTPAVEGLVY
jgi:hypothetical protein